MMNPELNMIFSVYKDLDTVAQYAFGTLDIRAHTINVLVQTKEKYCLLLN
jgi:hypothetical protein